MEQQQHRTDLYKKHKRVASPKHHKRLNRKLLEANRQKKRNDLHQILRKMSPSPEPHSSAEDKENDQGKSDEINRNVPCNTSTVVIQNQTKLIITARDPEKIKKAQAYHQRLIEYKEKKKAMLEEKKANKKRPFVSAVNSSSGFGGKAATNGSGMGSKGAVSKKPSGVPTTAQPSFVPNGHKGFTPPEGLKDHGEMENKEKEKLKSRLSVYTIVPTPPKKPKATNGFPSTRKALPTYLRGHHINTISKNDPMQIATSTASTTRTLKMGPPSVAMPVKKPPISTRIKKSETAAPKVTASIKVTNMPKRPLNNKRVTVGKNSPPQSSLKNANLSQAMKAKKPRAKPSAINIKRVPLIKIQMEDLLTPRESTNTNQLEEFVTSTQVKNCTQSFEELKGISPIVPMVKKSATLAKRSILQQTTAKEQLTERRTVEEEKPHMKSKSRFNFIRYSEVNVTINDALEDEEAIKNIEKAAEMHQNLQREPTKGEDLTLKADVSTEDEKTQMHQNLQQEPKKDEDLTLKGDVTPEDEKTPTKQRSDNDDKPVNYLSPFVSVSRGKVSLKKEKEKRNSMYLANPVPGEELLNVSQHNDSTVMELGTSQYSVEVRRTLEAVRYYRKQLQAEIDRLHAKCDSWEEYKKDSIEMLQSLNVDDMIDGAVGQTRLLTSKKFMQFKGLIDRCEAGATGVGQRPDDGSEDTKSISAIDLEGFWSMLGLQVDNLDKRFDNLNSWRNNNWQDPHEVVKPKTKRNLATVMKKTAVPLAKAKARPNSALQQMLRKMRSNNANKTPATVDDVVLTPSIVRDRKYFSPAATVVSIPTASSSRRLSLLGRKKSQDSASNSRMSLEGADSKTRRNSKHSPGILNATAYTPGIKTRRTTLYESAILSNAEAVNAGFSSPKLQSRKSILKTPGSARTNLRNVLFNQKCRVKRFNFIINDGEDDDALVQPENNESIEEDVKQNPQDSDHETDEGRKYILRNRKVRLRPFDEIIIPVKKC